MFAPYDFISTANNKTLKMQPDSKGFMAIKEKDFVEINFTGRIQESGQVFDTTDPKVAKENNLGEGEFKPIIVCVGQGHLIKGLDEWIIGKEPGKYENITVPAIKAYGKKDAKLIRMIPTQQFTKYKIKPERGLQVNIDGIVGMIRTVTGGRTVVDFNHPLAGKDLVYDIEIIRKVDDKKEQVDSLLKLLVNVDAQTEIKEGKAKIKVTLDIPKEVQEKLKKTIKDLVGVEAEFVKEDKKEEVKGEAKKETEEKKEDSAETKTEEEKEKKTEKKEETTETKAEKDKVDSDSD